MRIGSILQNMDENNEFIDLNTIVYNCSLYGSLYAEQPMTSEWIIDTNAKNERNSKVLFNRFVKQLYGEVVHSQCIPNSGVGYKVKWTMNHKVVSWSELLLDVLQMAQNVGNGWLLTGDVTCRCSAWCNRPKVAGVQTIEWTIEKSSSDSG